MTINTTLQGVDAYVIIRTTLEGVPHCVIQDRVLLTPPAYTTYEGVSSDKILNTTLEKVCK